MSGGGGPKRLILIVVVVVVAAIAGGSAAIFGPWGAGTGAGTGDRVSTQAGAGTDVPGGSGAGGDGGAAGSVPATGGSAISVSGSLSGSVTDVSEVSCTPEAGGSWAWRLVGTVDGEPLTLSFNTNYYRGAGSYNTTGVSDERGGFMSLEHGQGADIATVGSNGATKGTFTVAADGRSGQIDADLTDTASGREVHVTGPWRCT
jgi:hypothetical protein